MSRTNPPSGIPGFPPAAPAAAAPSPEERQIEQGLREFRDAFQKVQQQVHRTIVGQDTIVRHVLACVFLQGHVLLEGVPGLGKTLLVNAVAGALGLRATRVQFTPDLMPADIIGTRVFQQEPGAAARFEFERGPLFTQLLLADEINRASPKTQSALLEAMQERNATVAGVTYPLPKPFMVLATQNPLEQEGTYPLPEAQLDRFLFKLLVRFPTQLELVEITRRTTGAAEAQFPPIINGPDRILAWAALVRRVPVSTQVIDFAARLLLATHPKEGSAGASGIGKYIRCGASPRGLQAMILAAKLRAVLDGRLTVTRDDIIDAAKPALRHRILLTFEAEAEGVRADNVIERIVQMVSG